MTQRRRRVPPPPGGSIGERCRRLLEDPVYQANLARHWRAGKVPTSMKRLVLAYAPRMLLHNDLRAVIKAEMTRLAQAQGQDQVHAAASTGDRTDRHLHRTARRRSCHL
jgi:hypothetical protein